ncbi:M48 family metalloprotease [Endothiovibrio diazotrophicus]
MAMTKRFGPWLLLAALGLLGGCAANPVTGDSDLVLMSEQQELSLGRQGNAEVIKQYGEYADPELKAYVDRVGKAMAAHSHRPGLIYRFTVLDSPEVNAFALPGGYIYITRGLLALLDSEAELAAVLGHELGHVTARHAVRQHTSQVVTGLLGAVIAAGTGIRGAGDVANLVGTAVVRGYGREHELEADRLGAEYLARDGYDPQAMIQVIRVLKGQEAYERQRAEEEGREPNLYHGLFATHPDNDTRLQEVVAAADQFRSGETARTDRDAFLRRLDGLTWGDSASQGILRGDTFYHPDLDFRLQAIDGWVLVNHADNLEARRKDGDARLLLSVADRNRRIEPQAFLRERLGIRDLREGQEIDLNGLQGYTGITDGKTTWGNRPVRVAVLYHGDRAFVFQGASKSADDPFQHDAEIVAVARTFRPMTADERKRVNALHLKVRPLKGGETFVTLARHSPIADHPEEQLRLLNGRYPDGEPPAGLVKVVE